MKVELSAGEWRCLEALLQAIERGDLREAERLAETLHRLFFTP